MTLPQLNEPAPIAANARCATCRAPLATDQLFCLSCGTRRRDARIAFRDVLATEAAPVVAAGGGGWPPAGTAELSAPAGGPVGPGRISYMPFLATLALLLFALAVGVWVGRKPVQAVAGPTPAVPVQAVAATTPAAAEEDPAAAEDDAAADDAAEEDASADEPAAPVKDDTSALKNLEKLSPEEYQKQSQKLPDEVGTGGTAPPKDNKPAGGGSDVEVFE